MGEGSIHVEAAYRAEALCGFDGGRPIDPNATDRCGALQRSQIATMCKTLKNRVEHLTPPMNAGPKNLLDFLVSTATTPPPPSVSLPSFL